MPLGYIGNAVIEIPLLSLGTWFIFKVQAEERVKEEQARLWRSMTMDPPTWDTDAFDRPLSTQFARSSKASHKPSS